MVVHEPQNILAWEPESASALQHFSATAWCARLLRRPELRLFRCRYAGRKPRGWDPVVSGLLAAAPAGDGEGVRHFLSAVLVAPAGGAAGCPSLTGAGASSAASAGLYGGGAARRTNPFAQHVNFYALGAGLAGHPRTVHGGVLALLVDSAFAQLGFVHGRPGARFYSAYTNMRFVRPVVLPPPPPPPPLPNDDDDDDDDAEGGRRRRRETPSPGGVVDVVVRAQVDSRRTREGDRKIFVLARVEGEDGVVFVTAEGLLIEKDLVGAARL